MTIQEIANTVIRGEKAIIFPLKIHNGTITDSKGSMIAQIRGWGWIQYLDNGGPKAEALQDGIGNWIVETLNQQWERSKEEGK